MFELRFDTGPVVALDDRGADLPAAGHCDEYRRLVGAAAALVLDAPHKLRAAADELLVGLDDAIERRPPSWRRSIISRIACPIFQAVFWLTPRRRASTTDEIPLLDVRTRKKAWIHSFSGSLVACSGVRVVTVNW